MSRPADQPAEPRRRPRRKRVRWTVGCCLTLTVLAVATVLLVSRPVVLKAVILPRIASSLNCVADARSIGVGADGHVTIHDLSLRARGVSGPAAEFLSAPLVRIESRPLAALMGGEAIQAITLVEPRMRISQDTELGLNIGEVLRSNRGAGARRIPNVHIRRGALEVGEHKGASYANVLSVEVGGSLIEESRSGGLYSVHLTEITGDEESLRRAPLTVSGSVDVNLGLAELTIDAIDFTSLAKSIGPKSTGAAFKGFWQRFDIEGQIPSATVDYNREDGLDVAFSLDRVRATFPMMTRSLSADGIEAPGVERPLAMTDLSGEASFNRAGLRADLRGAIEDLACEVMITTDTLEPGAPFLCDIRIPRFVISDEPPLLPFAPSVALKVFERFSGPTATLAGNVIVRREEGGADIEYTGVVQLRDGEARYESFPYPISDIEALFEFDQKRFSILQLTGVGPAPEDGSEPARLMAVGEIAPPGDGAAVDLRIHVSNVPLDDEFRDALPADRRAVISTLFHRPSFERLVAEGLVLERGEAERLDRDIRRTRQELEAEDLDDAARRDLERRLRTLEERRAIPEFGLEDRANLNVQVIREAGTDKRYTSIINLRADRAGLLLKPFPYPAIAEDIDLRLLDGEAILRPFRVRGLRGGEGSIGGRVVYQEEGASVPVRPDIDIAADGVPIDELLIQALPDLSGGREFDPASLVRSLGLSGSIDMTADITPGEDDRLRYDVAVELEELNARPEHGRLTLDDLRGRIQIENQAIRVEDLAGGIGDGRFALSLQASGEGEAWDLQGALEVLGLDLALPLEDLVEHFGPERAEPLKQYRERLDPTGLADGRLDFDLHGDEVGYLITVDRLVDAGFDTPHGRSWVSTRRGRVAFQRRSVSFSDLEVELRAEDQPPTIAAIEGAYPINEDNAPDLEVLVAPGRFEAPALRWAMTALAPNTRSWFEDLDPAGAFEMSVRSTPLEDNPAKPRIDWTCRPTTLAFTRRDTRVELDDVSGVVSGVEPGPVTIEDLSARTDAWEVSVAGTVTRDPDPTLDATLSLDVATLDDALLAILPKPAHGAVTAVDLELDGRLVVDGARLRYVVREEPAAPEFAFTALARHAGLSASAGLRVEDIDGYTSLEVESGVPGRDPLVSLDVRADRFSVLGARATKGRATFRSSGEPGDITLESIEAELHGGRLTGRARFADAAALGVGSEGPGFEFHSELAGVDFGSLLADIKNKAEPPVADTSNQGLLDAQLSLSGAVRDPLSRRGRCSARVQGGDVLNMPGVTPILELSNLQAPVGEEVDLAFADCFLAGDVVAIDQLALYSDSLRIAGTGSVAWPSTELDIAVEASGSRHLPVFSHLLEALRGEIVSTHVSGTLGDPEFRVEQLSSTRRLLGVMLGEDDEDD